MPLPLTDPGRLTQSEVEAMFRKFVEKYELPNRLRDLPSVPEGAASSPREQDSGVPPPTSPLSEQPLPDCSLETTPLIPQGKHYESCFTH